MHCTDRVTLAAYRCIEEDNFGWKLQALPDLLIAFWSVGTRCSLSSPVCLQCNCSILSLPLYMFVVAVLTTLPLLCSAMFSLLRALLLSSSTPLAIDLISVLQRSYGGKASPWRISRHLLCLLFCVKEIVRDSPIVNFVSQTLNKHISPYGYNMKVCPGHVALPSKKKCAVTSNYCMRSWRPPSDIYKYRWALRVCSLLWSTRGPRTACLS